MPLSVFISSTSELETYPPGRASYRDKVRDAVIKAGLHPVMSEYWASSGAALPLEECLERVKGSNVVVVIVAHKYGSVPPDQPKPERKSITWRECEQAVKDGNEVLAFLIDDKYPWPMDMVATSRKRDLGRFKEWLLGRGIRSKFTTPEDLEAKVLKFIDYYNRTMAKPFRWTYTGKPLTA